MHYINPPHILSRIKKGFICFIEVQGGQGCGFGICEDARPRSSRHLALDRQGMDECLLFQYKEAGSLLCHRKNSVRIAGFIPAISTSSLRYSIKRVIISCNARPCQARKKWAVFVRDICLFKVCDCLGYAFVQGIYLFGRCDDKIA